MRFSIVVALDPAHGVVEEGDELAGDAGYCGVYQTGHHERMVQQVVGEVGVGEPYDTIDGNHSHHTALSNGSGDGLLGRSLAEDDHQRCGGNHHNLDDEVHLQWGGCEVG